MLKFTLPRQCRDLSLMGKLKTIDLKCAPSGMITYYDTLYELGGMYYDVRK